MLLARFLLTLVVATTLSFHDAGGQEAKTTDPGERIAALEKRVAKLEAELEAVKKQAANPKKRPEPKIQLVALGRTSPRTAIKVMRAIFGDRPGFKATRLDDFNLLLITAADEKTLQDALAVVKQLEPYGDKK